MAFGCSFRACSFMLFDPDCPTFGVTKDDDVSLSATEKSIVIAVQDS